jgi:DnaK suppressor protein
MPPATRKSRASGKKQPGASVEALTEQDTAALRQALLARRAELTGHIASFKDAAVSDLDSTNWEEDGTDAFDREFAFKMAGSRQDQINHIDEALERMDGAQYGVCDECGAKVGRARMMALPFCRTCIACQSASEAGRVRRSVRLPD